MDEKVYRLVNDKLIEMDDFVQATGTMMRTKAGEISVRVIEFRLLSKSLSPLPVIKQKVLDDGSVVEFGEFSDVETRYRQRYADLAVNRDVREVFRQAGAGDPRAAPFLRLARLSRSRDADLAAGLRRRGGASVCDASQPTASGFVSAHQLRAVPQAAAGRRL